MIAGLNPESAKSFVDRVKTLYAEIAFEQEQHAWRFRNLCNDIDVVIEEALDELARDEAAADA